MKRLKSIETFWALAGAFAALLFSSAAASQDTPGVSRTEIKIGAWMPLTGPLAVLGEANRAGAVAYFKMINERGGINGRKVTYIAEDDAYNPQRTAAAARKLISRDGVFAIVAAMGTGPSAAVFPYVLDDVNVPVINTFGGAKDWYTPARPSLFGVQGLHENQAKVIGRWAAKDGHKKIIVVHSAVAVYENIGKEVPAAVKTVTPDASVEFYPVKFGTADFGPIVLELASKKPDALILITPSGDTAALTKQLGIQGFRPPLYSYVPAVSNAVLDLGGPAIEGMKAISFTVPITSDSPAIKEYRDALAKYEPKERPDYYSLITFGMAKIFGEAVRRINGPVTRASLIKSFESMHDYDSGVFPPVSFSADRHLGGRLIQRVQISGGKWVPVGEFVDSEENKW